MNKKGFTLIELLAVIVILAIIALIATPIILGIIEDAREGAKERSADLIANSVELAYQTKYALNNGKMPTFDQVKAQLALNGIDKATINGNVITSQDGVECTLSQNAGYLEMTCEGFRTAGNFKAFAQSIELASAE